MMVGFMLIKCSIALKLVNSYCEPNGFSNNAEEGQAEDIQVETRIQR